MIPDIEPRRCRAQACNKKLRRKKGEVPSRWLRRTCCDETCRMAFLRQRVLELDSKKKTLRCEGCKKPQRRSCRMKKAVCQECENARRETNATLDRLEKREQVKRYRTLMTILGFEKYEDCLAYLKSVPWTVWNGQTIRDLKQHLATRAA